MFAYDFGCLVAVNFNSTLFWPTNEMQYCLSTTTIWLVPLVSGMTLHLIFGWFVLSRFFPQQIIKSQKVIQKRRWENKWKILLLLVNCGFVLLNLPLIEIWKCFCGFTFFLSKINDNLIIAWENGFLAPETQRCDRASDYRSESRAVIRNK